MGRIVVTEFVSLDGVMEDPGGAEGYEHGGWTFAFDRGEGDDFKLQETLDTEALLLGRTTYEGFAAAWPSREGEFADKFNRMPKFVVSSTLKQPDWNNSTVLEGDLAEDVARLSSSVGGNIVVRQRPAGTGADRARAPRRTATDGLPGPAWIRQAALRGDERHEAVAAHELEVGGRGHRDPDLRAGEAAGGLIASQAGGEPPPSATRLGR